MRLSLYANEQTVADFLRNFELWHWTCIEPFSAMRLGACGGRALNALAAALATGPQDDMNLTGATLVGKYFLGWIMGVPVIVLVIIYLIFN